MRFENVLKYAGPLALVCLLLGTLAVAVSVVHSFDVFWQLESGKYMWETGKFIRTDIFTLVPDAPRYEHTWLHDLVLFGTYQLAGYAGISILKGLLVFAAAVLLVTAAKLRGASWAAIALVFPMFFLTSGGWLERPQLWTFLMFAAFILILDWASRHNSWHILWIFPITVAWANLHAGSVLSVALISAYFVGTLANNAVTRQFDRRLLIKLVTAAVAIFVAALLTPYPDKLLGTLLYSPNLGAAVDAAGKTTGPSTAVLNMDWTPTTFQMEPLFFYAIGVCVLIMLLGWRKLNAVDICLIAGLSFMGLKLVRHIPFLYMGAIAVLPVYLDATVQPIKNRLPAYLKNVALTVCLLCALWAGWTLWSPLYRVYGVFGHGLRTWHYPIEATEFLKEEQLAKNIYNTYDWGGYLAWKLFPEYHVFWDGRQTSKKMFDLGWLVMAGKPEWQDILNQFDVKTIVTRSSTIDTGQKYPLLDRLRQSPDWFLVFNDEASMIFVKRGSMPEAWMHKHVRPKVRMDDTILSGAILMVNVDPKRYMAWWDISQIFLKRKDYKRALSALQQHIARSPRPNPKAIQIRDELVQYLQKQPQQRQ